MAGKCVFKVQDGVKVHKPAQKNIGQHSTILTKQAWSIKDLLYGFWGKFSSRSQWVVLGRQVSCILTAQVTNHRVEFGSSCPLTEQAM